VLRLPVIAKVVPNLQILVIVVMEDTRSSETAILTRAMRRKIQEDGMFFLFLVTYKQYA
jgi:hypothetical protein